MLSIATLTNAWAIVFYNQFFEWKADIEKRTTAIEKSTITKQDMIMINEALLDKFELHLQEKYRIKCKE